MSRFQLIQGYNSTELDYCFTSADGASEPYSPNPPRLTVAAPAAQLPRMLSAVRAAGEDHYVVVNCDTHDHSLCRAGEGAVALFGHDEPCYSTTTPSATELRKECMWWT